jgi:hypothetical protein
VIEHIVDGDERHPGSRSDLRALLQTRSVIAAVEHRCRKPHTARCGRAQN